MGYSRVKDQEVAARLLRNITGRGRIPNGLLFWGPAGVGKSLAAHEFAKALNCAKKGGDACDACLSCRKTDHGNHPDVKVISPKSRSRVIKVDAVNEMTEMTMYRPFEGGRRVFIIEDADRMNEPAQNHFLKTLEEPVSATVFVLITSAPRLLLPTIRSRCQAVRFGALRPETVAELLTAQAGVSPEKAAALAALSQGQMGRALDLALSGRRDLVMDVVDRLRDGEDPLVVADRFTATLDKIEKDIAAKVREGLEAASGEDDPDGDGEAALDQEDRRSREEIEAQVASRMRQERYELVYLFQTWYRDELVYRAAGDPDRVLNRDRMAALASMKSPGRPEKLEALNQAWVYLERNISPGRVFRDLFFTLAG